VFQYRQVLVRLHQGDSDRDIDRSRLRGRPKVAVFRALAAAQSWLAESARQASAYLAHEQQQLCRAAVRALRAGIIRKHPPGDKRDHLLALLEVLTEAASTRRRRANAPRSSRAC
jgi:hypothetical protein